MYLRIKDSITVVDAPRECQIHFLDGFSARSIDRTNKELLDSIQLLIVGANESDIYDLLGFDFGLELLQFLNSHEILLSAKKSQSGTRFDQQLNYYSEFSNDSAGVLQDLADKVVAVIGLGGIGGGITRHLACCGIRNFILVDGDIVQESNLNRQYYTSRQVGMPKVHAMSSFLHDLNHQIDCDSYPLFINAECHLAEICKNKHVDLIICSADQPKNEIEIMVANCAERLECACSFSGVNVKYGYWGPILDTTISRNQFIQYIRQLREMNVLSQGITCSTSFTNDLIVALSSKDIIHYLTGIASAVSKNRIFRYNFQNNCTDLIKTFGESSVAALWTR